MPAQATTNDRTKLDDERGGYRLAQDVTGLTRASLYSQVFRGQIPHFRIGKRTVVFSRRELEEWLERGRVQARRHR